MAVENKWSLSEQSGLGLLWLHILFQLVSGTQRINLGPLIGPEWAVLAPVYYIQLTL